MGKTPPSTSTTAARASSRLSKTHLSDEELCRHVYASNETSPLEEELANRLAARNQDNKVPGKLADEIEKHLEEALRVLEQLQEELDD